MPIKSERDGALAQLWRATKRARWLLLFVAGALSTLKIAQEALDQQTLVPVLQSIVDFYNIPLQAIGDFLAGAMEQITGVDFDFLEPHWIHVLALFVTFELGIVWRTLSKAGRTDIVPVCAYVGMAALLIVPTTLFAAVISGLNDPRNDRADQDTSELWGVLIAFLILQFFALAETVAFRGERKRMRTVRPLIQPIMAGVIVLCLPALLLYQLTHVQAWNGYIVGMLILLITLGLALLFNRVVFSDERLAIAQREGRFEEAIVARNDTVPLAVNLLGGVVLAAWIAGASLALEALSMGG